jgi:putative transposase
MTNLDFGKYYHIYNRGINGCNLFYTQENYHHFLRLYEKYIGPIAETYAWVLLKNHFHLLVRIKDKSEIDLSQLPTPVHSEVPVNARKLKAIHMYFSDLFNAYSQAINKQEHRTGSLFQRPFKRIEVRNETYFKHLIIYIHLNPVHHEFTDKFEDYPWSSYGTVISLQPTKLRREEIIGRFTGKAEFIDLHNKEIDSTFLNNFVIED